MRGVLEALAVGLILSGSIAAGVVIAVGIVLRTFLAEAEEHEDAS